MGLKNFRLLLDKLCKGCNRLGKLVFPNVQFSQKQDGLGVPWVESNDTLKAADCLDLICVCQLGNGEVVMRLRDAWVSSGDAFKVSDGLGVVSFSDADAAQKKHGVIIAGIARKYFPGQRSRVVMPALGQCDFSQTSIGRKIVRRPFYNVLEKSFCCREIAGAQFEVGILNGASRADGRQF